MTSFGEEQMDILTQAVLPKDSPRCFSEAKGEPISDNIASQNFDSQATALIDQFSVNIKRDNS